MDERYDPNKILEDARDRKCKGLADDLSHYYVAFLEAGFSKAQAMNLISTMLHTILTVGGVK